MARSEIDRTKVTVAMMASVMLKMDIKSGLAKKKARIDKSYMKEAGSWINLPTDEWEDWMIKALNEEIGLFA